MDATGPVRNYLKENDIHDYSLQSQGPEHKVIIKAFLYSELDIAKSSASLYRPQTKKGDPRIWFSGLKRHSSPNDLIAILAFEDKLHLFNLTTLDLSLIHI